MTEQELLEFKGLLEEKRISIMRDLGLLETRSMNTTTADSSGGPIYSDHMSELGSDAIEREKAFMFASRDGAYISQLEDALARIKDGSFGTCRVCSQPIPIARLEAVPTTTLCVPCKEAEQDQKQRTA
jgi:RNA polymerase-binding protein DksA